jgi:ADP-ribose pyrophosphatase
MSNPTSHEVTQLAEGRFLRLVKRGHWEFVERIRKEGSPIKAIVAVVAVTPDRRLILADHFNPPFARRSIELPAGLVGDVLGKEGEAIGEAATRELLEETGYAADRMTFLATAATSSGLCTEQVSLFRAEGLKKVSKGGGVEGEAITVREVPVEQVKAWLAARVREGCIVDMKIYAALSFVE